MAKRDLAILAARDDERALLGAAEEIGFRAVRTVLKPGEAPVLHAPTAIVLDEDESVLDLVPPGVSLDDLGYMPVLDGGTQVDLDSPTVQVIRSYVRDAQLHQGGLYVRVPKGHSLEGAATRGFDLLKRWLSDWEVTTELGCRVGPEAAAQYRRGAVRLMSGAVELDLPDR